MSTDLLQLEMSILPDLPSKVLRRKKIKNANDQIRVKVQMNGKIALHQGKATVNLNPKKMQSFIQDLRIAKRRATRFTPEKFKIDEVNYQPENLYAQALLEIMSKSIAEEINETLKRECMACFNPNIKFLHKCYVNDPREKVDNHFNQAFRLVDIWTANEMAFEQTKDQFNVAVRDRDLCLTRSDILRNAFFMDKLKTAVMKVVL